jgi:signal transduction histidine kinase
MRAEKTTLLQQMRPTAVGCVIGVSASLLFHPADVFRPGDKVWLFAAWLVGIAIVTLGPALARSVRSAGRAEVTRVVAAAVQAERAAIARDLHDSVSHHLSAVGVHAAAARLSLGGPSSPLDPAKSSLQQVEVSSRSAMADLRSMLSRLHGTAPGGTRQPALDTLDDLVRSGRSAGLAVDLRLDHVDPESLPDSLNIAAYRIIQETLTNALRHGDGALVLTVSQTATELRVTGSNAMPMPHAHLTHAGTGWGLDGMRHRAGQFGGSVSIGPDPDRPGTWNTSLTLPLRGARDHSGAVR